MEADRSLPKGFLEKHFTKREDIWYSQSRLKKMGYLETRDLDCLPFFDA